MGRPWLDPGCETGEGCLRMQMGRRGISSGAPRCRECLMRFRRGEAGATETSESQI